MLMQSLTGSQWYSASARSSRRSNSRDRTSSKIARMSRVTGSGTITSATSAPGHGGFEAVGDQDQRDGQLGHLPPPRSVSPGAGRLVTPNPATATDTAPATSAERPRAAADRAEACAARPAPGLHLNWRYHHTCC